MNACVFREKEQCVIIRVFRREPHSAENTELNKVGYRANDLYLQSLCLINLPHTPVDDTV